MTVARGAGAKPTFQQVTVAGPGSKAGAPGTARHGLVVLEPLAGGVLLGNEPTAGKAARAAAKADANDVKVLGRDGLDDTAMLVRATDGALTGQKRKVARELEAAPARADEVDEEEEEGVPQGPDAEQTLGARVAALEGTAAGASGQDDAAAAAPLPAGSQKADSLVVLLTQALRSNDRALLERCIATSNDRIITNTVRRLLPIDAAAFLRAAVERLQSKPSRGAQLATWIRAVLLHHTAYLMAAPGVQPSLAGLYQTIEARLQMHRNLLSLSGRLDLLLSQASRGGADGADDGDEGGPLTYYEEGDEDEDVAVEDPFALAEGDDALPSGDDDDEDDDDDDEGDEDEDEGGDGDDHMMGLGDDDDFDDDDE